MTAEHFDTTLEALMAMKPFQRFTIELNTGQRYEIGHPRAAAFQDGTAVLLAPGGVPVFFDHDSVNQIINDLARSAPGKRRSKRRPQATGRIKRWENAGPNAGKTLVQTLGQTPARCPRAREGTSPAPNRGRRSARQNGEQG